MASIGGLAGSGAALPGGFVEDNGAGGGDVEGADAAGHRDAEEVVAGATDEVVETGAFAAEDEDAIAGEVELVVVGGAALVEADDPDVLLLQLFQCADEVDDAGDAEMLGGAGAGFHGYWAQRCGAAFGEDDAVNAGAVGDAEKRSEILRIFDAVEREKQARLRGIARGEEIFDGEQFLRADECDDALVGSGSGEVCELVAGFLADADTGQFAIGNEAREAFVVALGGNQNVIEAAATGPESFGNGMHAVENFHVSSVDAGALRNRSAAGYGETALYGFRGAAFAAVYGLRVEDSEEMIAALG